MESVGDGFTWRRQNSSVEIDEDTLDDRMRERIAAGVQNLRADVFVKVSDAHLEAKALYFIVRPPLWHRQLQLRAGHVQPAAEGLQESSTISAVFLQTVIEVLLLATGHDHKAQPVLVEPAQGSF